METPIKAIKRIQVKRLFGTYDYDLFPSTLAAHPERLLILYGDNGSGKTTKLRIIFHLLVPEDGESHKTEVAGIPFSSVQIDFSSGERIWAERSGELLTGNFTMGLTLAQKKFSLEFVANEEGAVRATSPEHDVRIKEFLFKLWELNIGLYLLSDDRTVRLAGRDRKDTPFIPPDVVDENVLFYHDVPVNTRLFRGKQLQIRPQQLLVESIKRAEIWIQSQGVRSAAQGESDVNTLYGVIVKRMSSLPLKESQGGEFTVPDLESRIRGNVKRSGTLFNNLIDIMAD